MLSVKERGTARWNRAGEQAVRQFLKSGTLQHSALAMTLPYVINYCEKNKIQYTLTSAPGRGYFIRMIGDADSACRSKRIGNQMVCEECKQSWDANSLNPPTCVPFLLREKTDVPPAG